jgi:CRISPR system Cascade subunit CasA
MKFNLIDEPFLPCLMPDGGFQEFGLKEALERAHEIAELRDQSPIITLALHRLLLAILHRIFGAPDLESWADLWRGGRFDAGSLNAYFEKWHGRFDLCDNDHPFYQTGGMTTEQPLFVNALFDELAGGNNATLFDHTSEAGGGKPVPLNVAARGLVARQAFALGLGVSPDVRINGRLVKTGNRKDGPLARGLVILVRGDSLFQTLLCNLTRFDAAEGDLPVWERDDPEALAGASAARGRLDLYTWQCRRLRLVLPSDPTCPVERVHFAQGRELSKDELDPMKPYRRDKNQRLVPFPVDPERAVWRDSAALFELTNDALRPAEALNWMAQAARDRVVPRHRTLTLDAFAVGTQAGKATSIILWRHDRMPLPLDYLDDRELVAHLKHALSVAEDVAAALRRCAWVMAASILAPGDSKPDRDRVSGLVDSLSPDRLYWSRLEVPFRQFLVDLPGDPADRERQAHRERRLARWVLDALRPTARRAFDETAGQLDHSARVLRAVSEAGAKLTRELGSLCSPFKEYLHEQTR